MAAPLEFVDDSGYVEIVRLLQSETPYPSAWTPETECVAGKPSVWTLKPLDMVFLRRD
jgi:hypothetical protein